MAAFEELGHHEFIKKIHIERGRNGFGFNIKGTTASGGQHQAINGLLLPPLQYISHVDKGQSL